MFQGIRRVVSEADDFGGDVPMREGSPTEFEPKTAMEEDYQNQNSFYWDEGRGPPVAIVETDTTQQNKNHNQVDPMEIQNDPLTVFESHVNVPSLMMMAQQHHCYSSSSSLSSDEEIEDKALVNLQTATKRLLRMNSRESWSSSHHAASSQNSSRDWGFFVHLTDRGEIVDAEASQHAEKGELKPCIDSGT